MPARKKSPEDPSPSPDDSGADEGIEPGVTFEEAIEEVESIVQEMEDDRVPLDQLLERYERGTRLLAFCQEKIDAAQARIEIIGSGGRDGAKSLREFDESAPAEQPAPNPAATSPRTKRSPVPSSSAPSEVEEEDDEPASDEIRLL